MENQTKKEIFKKHMILERQKLLTKGFTEDDISEFSVLLDTDEFLHVENAMQEFADQQTKGMVPKELLERALTMWFNQRKKKFINHNADDELFAAFQDVFPAISFKIIDNKVIIL